MLLVLETYVNFPSAKSSMDLVTSRDRWSWWYASVRRLNRLGLGDKSMNDKVLAQLKRIWGPVQIRRFIDKGHFVIGDIVIYGGQEFRVSGVITHYTEPGYTITRTSG